MRALCTTEFIDSLEISNFFLKLRNCAHLKILDRKLCNLGYDVLNLTVDQLKSLSNLQRLSLFCKSGNMNINNESKKVNIDLYM